MLCVSLLMSIVMIFFVGESQVECTLAKKMILSNVRFVFISLFGVCNVVLCIAP